MKNSFIKTTLLLMLVFSPVLAQVGIGTTSPDNSAVLELQSTTKGFLPPRITTAQRDLIPSPSAGLIIFNTSTNAIEFCDGNNWVTYNERATTPVNTNPEPSGIGDVGINTTTPDVNAALELATTNQGFLPPRLSTNQRNDISDPPAGLLIYNTNTKSLQFYTKANWADFAEENVVISKTGEIWMDRNLGASQVATSSFDTDSYGDLYQWGRNSDGHEDRNSSTTSGPVSAGSEGSDFINASSDWLITQDDFRWGDPTEADKGGQDPCPNGYRVPTQSEWQAEINEGNWSNATDAFASPLKLPEAGFRANTTISPFDEIQYWSSSVSGNDAVYLSTYNSIPANLVAGPRYLGFSVRCIKD